MHPGEERLTIQVQGMTCSHCELRVEGAVRGVAGVLEVRASAPLGEVEVTLERGAADLEAVHAAIRHAGYEVSEDAAVGSGADTPIDAVPSVRAPAAVEPAGRPVPPTVLARFLGLLAIIAAGYVVIRFAVGVQFLPKVSQDMGYGLIFVVGLLTSIHCVAMCGGIVLSQGITRREAEASRPSGTAERLLPSVLYNGGRIVSYTIIGGVVGGIGSLLSLSPTLKAAVPVIAGVFMLFLGVRMLGIIPWLSRLQIRVPGVPSHAVSRAASRRGPFVVGLLNGLMPCGPLQTLQVYALGTGSFFAGALSMFLFSVGTVPLLLGFGLVSSLLSARFNRGMLKASGVLVMLLGLVMFSRGLSLFGLSVPGTRPLAATAGLSRVTGDVQLVSSTVESGTYHPIMVQAGIPVKWTISVKADDINGCNSPLTVPAYGISKELRPGDNIIEFTPAAVGDVTYTCWMGMISSTIHVVDDLSAAAGAGTPVTAAVTRNAAVEQSPPAAWSGR